MLKRVEGRRPGSSSFWLGRANPNQLFGGCSVINHPMDIRIVGLIEPMLTIAFHRLKCPWVTPHMLLDMAICKREVCASAMPARRQVVPAPASHIDSPEQEVAIINTVLVCFQQYIGFGWTRFEEVVGFVKMVSVKGVAEARHLASFVRRIPYIRIHRTASHARQESGSACDTRLIGGALENRRALEIWRHHGLFFI